MKKKLLLSFIAVICAAGTLLAQDAGRDNVNSVDFKTKFAITKMTDLGLTEPQRVSAIRVFTYYYKQLETNVPKEQAISFRDNKLKNLFTETQMTNFIEKYRASVN
jgi:hypothetical protein